MIIIDCIHFLFILLILLVPFLKNEKKNYVLKTLYIWLIPTMWIHWYLCFGHCGLTMLDNYLCNRNIFSNEGFLFQIFNGIYSLTSTNQNVINYSIWIISIGLWIKVLYDYKYHLKKDGNKKNNI